MSRVQLQNLGFPLRLKLEKNQNETAMDTDRALSALWLIVVGHGAAGLDSQECADYGRARESARQVRGGGSQSACRGKPGMHQLPHRESGNGLESPGTTCCRVKRSCCVTNLNRHFTSFWKIWVASRNVPNYHIPNRVPHKRSQLKGQSGFFSRNDTLTNITR